MTYLHVSFSESACEEVAREWRQATTIEEKRFVHKLYLFSALTSRRIDEFLASISSCCRDSEASRSSHTARAPPDKQEEHADNKSLHEDDVVDVRGFASMSDDSRSQSPARFRSEVHVAKREKPAAKESGQYTDSDSDFNE